MATPTTTMRMPVELRDEIARLAAQRKSTMLDVVTDAVEQLRVQQWWDQVRDQLDAWTPEQIEEYRREAAPLESTLRDGIE